MLFEFWRGENFRKKISAGTLVFLRSRRRRKLVWNAQLQTWRTVDTNYGRCRGRKLQRQWTFGILSYRCVGSELLEQGRWTRYDSHQRWTFERRSFVSHTSFSKSSQYLRNSADTLSFSSMEKSVSIGKVLVCPKLEPQEVDTLVQTLRTSVQEAGDRLQMWWKFLKLVNLMDSWGKSFRTIVQNHSRWDLEVRQACKRVYSFVIIQILKLLCGSVDTKIGRVLQTELMEWAASKNMEACFRRLFINLLRVECWEELIFSRMEIWWNDGS